MASVTTEAMSFTVVSVMGESPSPTAIARRLLKSMYI